MFLRSVALKRSRSLPDGYPFDVAQRLIGGCLEFPSAVTFCGGEWFGKIYDSEAIAAAVGLPAVGGDAVTTMRPCKMPAG